MFSHEMRASIRKEHPEYAFGEISRIIGVEVITHAKREKLITKNLIKRKSICTFSSKTFKNAYVKVLSISKVFLGRSSAIGSKESFHGAN